jgi:hypothetical protein
MVGGGWRDDVFMAAVTFSRGLSCAHQRDPSRKNAVFRSRDGGGLLTRITALSFVVPGLWRGSAVERGSQNRVQRARMATAVALLCAIIVA